MPAVLVVLGGWIAVDLLLLVLWLGLWVRAQRHQRTASPKAWRASGELTASR